MIIDKVEYITFSNMDSQFLVPTNQGSYPKVVDLDAVTRAWQVVEYKEVIEFESFFEVFQALRTYIKNVMDLEWLEVIKSTILGFMHWTPKEMLDHLKAGGGTLYDDDIGKVIANLTKPLVEN